MCFNQQPNTPQPRQITPPPPVKPLQIAATSKLDSRAAEPEKKKPVAYGAKSTREKTTPKRDAASLLIPMGDTGNRPGGLNT